MNPSMLVGLYLFFKIQLHKNVCLNEHVLDAQYCTLKGGQCNFCLLEVHFVFLICFSYIERVLFGAFKSTYRL